MHELNNTAMNERILEIKGLNLILSLLYMLIILVISLVYFITVNKYWFSLSVIGYINMQIIGIGIGYKKSISVDHYFWVP